MMQIRLTKSQFDLVGYSLVEMIETFAMMINDSVEEDIVQFTNSIKQATDLLVEIKRVESANNTVDSDIVTITLNEQQREVLASAIDTKLDVVISNLGDGEVFGKEAILTGHKIADLAMVYQMVKSSD